MGFSNFQSPQEKEVQKRSVGFHRKPTIQSSLKTKNKVLTSNMILVDEQDLINTYSQEEQLSCKKYIEYKTLIQGNPSFGYKRCAKLLGVPQGRTRWWHTKGAKKAVPIALKTVEKLKSAGLLPFNENHQHAPIAFNILGTLFGDGGIDCRLNTVAFISSDKHDVDLWLSDLIKIFPFAKGKTQIVEGGEYGHSYNARCYDRAVVRFLVALGTPVGNKVTETYTLPSWVLGSSNNSRIAFLDGYLASEVSIPKWRPTHFAEFYFANFSLGVSKIDSLESEHREFLKSVERLLLSVGISTTGNIYKSVSAGRLRKDGLTTANYRIFIGTNSNNVLSFNTSFSLRYAKDKKERLEKQVGLAKEYINSSNMP